MYTYESLAPDLHLIAIGVAVWIVAISIAFAVYVPTLRADGKLLRGFSPRSRRIQAAPYAPKAVWIVEDLDHAAITVDCASLKELVVAAPVALVPACPEAATAPIAADAHVQPREFSVLIVDDNAINRQVLELILDSIGVPHASVENGLEAVEAMQACAYGAVLMDLQMPVMDGFEATRRIRALETAQHAAPSRIIVVSANCEDEDVARGRQAGADRHLAKPLSAAELIRELAACSDVDLLAA
jgi:CheY-like chemotaxis protein